MADGGAKRPRILIIKPSSLGDVVHGLPVLAGLRAAFPHAHIAWLIAAALESLLAGHPLLDEVIPFDRRHYGRMLRSPRSLADFLRFARALRRRRFDWVIDLQGLFRSGLLAWLSGAPRRTGFAHARELAGLFYTERLRCRDTADVHAVELNLRLARAVNLLVDPPRFPLVVSPPACAAAREKLAVAAGAPLRDYLAVLPGTRWPSKHWRADRFADVIAQLHADGAPPAVLLGAPNDRAIADEIRARCRAPLINLVGRTNLPELAALLDGAAAVLCLDSGPMHIAAALGRPLVAVFGPTHPARTGPYTPHARVVQLALPCVPCYERRCPLGHHNCLEQLPAETVVAHVRELLATHAAAPTKA